MYLVFFGNDRQRVRDGATQYIDNNLPEGATLTTLDSNDYQLGQLADALGAASLFGGEEWFVLDGVSDNKEMSEEVLANLSEMSESGNTFVVLEGKLLAPQKKKYEKFSDKVEESKLGPADSFNTFAMADALSERDKRKLWVLLQEAKLNGQREEEIIGILWWQLKTLRLAAETSSASEAGMKDFPYNKAKRSLSKFNKGQVVELSGSLLNVYHDGHSGIRDIDLALEEWVLSV